MKRRLLNLLTVLSLLLCVAVVALWVQSIFWPVWVGRWEVQSHGALVVSGELQIHSTSGGLSVRHIATREPPNEFVAENRIQPFHGVRWRMDYPGDDYPYYERGVAGLEYVTMEGGQWMYDKGRIDLTVVTLPYWLLLVITAGGPAFRLLAGRRKRLRLKKSREKMACPSCGYDLRATPDKCPECGHLPAGAAA